jgi:hypothetical protein
MGFFNLHSSIFDSGVGWGWASSSPRIRSPGVEVVSWPGRTADEAITPARASSRAIGRAIDDRHA